MRSIVILLLLGSAVSGDDRLRSGTTAFLAKILQSGEVVDKLYTILRQNPALSCQDRERIIVTECASANVTSTDPKPNKSLLPDILGPLFFGFIRGSQSLDSANYNCSLNGLSSADLATTFLSSFSSFVLPNVSGSAQYSIMRTQLIESASHLEDGCASVRMETIKNQFHLFISFALEIEVQILHSNDQIFWNNTLSTLVRGLGELFFEINREVIVKIGNDYKPRLNNSNCIPCESTQNPSYLTGICTRTNLLLNVSNPQFVDVLVENGFVIDLLGQIVACNSSSNIPQCISYVVVAFEIKLDVIFYGSSSCGEGSTPTTPTIPTTTEKVYTEDDITSEDLSNVTSNQYRMARVLWYSKGANSSEYYHFHNYQYSNIIAKYPSGSKEKSYIAFCALKPEGLSKKIQEACDIVGLIYNENFQNVSTTTDLTNPNIRGYCSTKNSEKCGTTLEITKKIRTNKNGNNQPDGDIMLSKRGDSPGYGYTEGESLGFFWPQKYCSNDYEGN